MKCKHVHYLAHSWLNGHWIEEPYIVRRDAALILCVDCHEALPLGPARDTEQTAIEVRAAEIAATWADDRIPSDDIATSDCYGWRAHVAGMFPFPEEEAGYLARAIVEHDTESAA